MRDTRKLLHILGVRLDAQRGGEDKLADGGTEAGEEGVEGLYRYGSQRIILCHHPSKPCNSPFSSDGLPA